MRHSGSSLSRERFRCDARTLRLWLAGTAGAASRLQSTLASAVGHTGSLVAYQLSCSTARGILVPDQGLNPRLPPCKTDSQPLDHRGNPLILLLDALDLPSLLTATPEEREMTPKDRNSWKQTRRGPHSWPTLRLPSEERTLTQLSEAKPLFRVDVPLMWTCG